MPALVEMRQIAKTFGHVAALNGVDFTVHSDEVVGLVGDNGAGKSTLMKILTGVLQPDAGELWFGGRRVHFHSPLDSRHSGIEMVYQDLGLAMDRLGRQHLEGLQISLPSVAMPVERLSGGQRQSVAIARATAFQSRLVIMDEPAASLAVSEAAKVLALIKRLKGQGVSVILITHRLQDVLDVADRVVVLNRGTKVGDLPRVGTTMEQIVGLIVGKVS